MNNEELLTRDEYDFLKSKPAVVQEEQEEKHTVYEWVEIDQQRSWFWMIVSGILGIMVAGLVFRYNKIIGFLLLGMVFVMVCFWIVHISNMRYNKEK